MSQYQQIVRPWVVVKLLPGIGVQEVGRYRSRSDADGHCNALHRLVPDGHYQVVWWMAIEKCS